MGPVGAEGLAVDVEVSGRNRDFGQHVADGLSIGARVSKKSADAVAALDIDDTERANNALKGIGGKRLTYRPAHEAQDA